MGWLEKLAVGLLLFLAACGGDEKDKNNNPQNVAPYGLTARVANQNCLVSGASGLPPTVMPGKLSDTGCFANMVSRSPADGLVPFAVNAELWSDGAHKERYLVLPNNETIGFRAAPDDAHPGGGWDFPIGSVLIKTFTLDFATGGTTEAKPVETRILVKRSANAWEGYSYKWDAAFTDADLLTSSNTTTYDLGGTTHDHYFPSPSECLQCHSQGAGFALGPKTLQMNRNFTYPSGVTDNQLRAMAHIGLFTPNSGSDRPPELAESNIDSLPKIPDPSDANSGTVEQRARAYLYANCSHCHAPSAFMPIMDFRYDTPLYTGLPPSCVAPSDCDTNTVCVTSTSSLTSTPGEVAPFPTLRLKPHNANESMVWRRMKRRGAMQMPPLATFLANPVGTDLVQQWIDGLPADTRCP